MKHVLVLVVVNFSLAILSPTFQPVGLSDSSLPVTPKMVLPFLI